MLKQLWGWLNPPPPEPPQPDDIFARIELNLGALNHDVINQYSVRKAMGIRVRLASKSPKELSEWLSNAGRVVEKNEYVPEPWKASVRVQDNFVLDNWFTHEGYIVDPKAWLAENQPRINRLLKAFKKLEDDDLDYYQRNYNSVLLDTDFLLIGMRASIK